MKQKTLLQIELEKRVQASGMSKRHISLAIGSGPTLIRDIIEGFTISPKHTTLLKIANILQCTVDDLHQRPASGMAEEKAPQFIHSKVRESANKNNDKNKNIHAEAKELAAWLVKSRNLPNAVEFIVAGEISKQRLDKLNDKAIQDDALTIEEVERIISNVLKLG